MKYKSVYKSRKAWKTEIWKLDSPLFELFKIAFIWRRTTSVLQFTSNKTTTMETREHTDNEYILVNFTHMRKIRFLLLDWKMVQHEKK